MTLFKAPNRVPLSFKEWNLIRIAHPSTIYALWNLPPPSDNPLQIPPRRASKSFMPGCRMTTPSMLTLDAGSVPRMHCIALQGIDVAWWRKDAFSRDQTSLIGSAIGISMTGFVGGCWTRGHEKIGRETVCHSAYSWASSVGSGVDDGGRSEGDCR